MNELKKYQNYAKASGFFFLLAIIAGVIGMIFFQGLETLESDLTVFSTYTTRNLIGIICILVMAFACLNIAIPLYPVLKKYNEPMALSSVGFRIIETVGHFIVVLCFIAFLALSDAFVNAGTPDISFYTTLNEVIYKIYNYTGIIATMFFSLGFLLYSIIFYKTKLIPRWLSTIGIVGSIVSFSGQILEFFGIGMDVSIVFELLTIIFELIVGFWLIFKGFDEEKLKLLIS